MSNKFNNLPEYNFLEGEPWCSLRTGQDLKSWSKNEEIAWNQVHRQTEKYKFYIKAFDLLTENNVVGDYYEFGCHRVRTFRMALTEARHHNLTNMNFFAFDSFAGLPQNTGDHGLGDKWNVNQLVTTEEEFINLVNNHGVLVDKVVTFPGFYKDSLTDNLVKEMSAKKSKVFMACVDCDLYESGFQYSNFWSIFFKKGQFFIWTTIGQDIRGTLLKVFQRHLENSKKKQNGSLRNIYQLARLGKLL